MTREINIDDQGNITFSLNLRILFKVLAIAAVTAAAGFLPLEGLTASSRICLMIFVGAAGLWITEVIPPFATGILVIVLSVYLLGQPTLGPDAPVDYRIFLNPISSPTLILFFGGFILAVAATKHGLDIRLARAFIKPFGTRPQMVLLGVILTTALFSMFMSNTATAAMMIAILAPLFKHFEGRDPFKKALVLSIPFAANIGGMGTIIGTPPNAVAASLLGKLGYSVSFLKWMVVCVPIVVIMLFVLWVLLVKIYKPRSDHFEMLFPEELKLTWDLVVVVATFLVTVVLWLLEPVTGLSSALVALLPIMIFAILGIIGREDLKRIEWHVLILIAGGLTLGEAMKATGLSDVLVDYVKLIPVSKTALIVIMAFFAIFISNFMSNTAAANLMIPIVATMAAHSPVFGVVAIALACSLSMSLPISTPPNAIAFATQVIETRDMARYGTLVSALGMIVMLGILLVAQFVFHAF